VLLDIAQRWTFNNESVLYRILSAPSTNVMTTTRKYTSYLVLRGFSLHLTLSSSNSEPKHQKQIVKNLIKEPPFPLKYLYEKHGLISFENQVICNVVQNTITELGHTPYITELNRIFCTAAIAVHCVMLGLKDGGNDNVEFSVNIFQPMHAKLMKYIEEHINTNGEQSAWWEHHKSHTKRRLLDIHAFQL
jgi:hypothetical protein